MIKFSEIDESGSVLSYREIDSSWIFKCPFVIIDPIHYRKDGTCKCDDLEHRKIMIEEWEYTEEDFK